MSTGDEVPGISKGLGGHTGIWPMNVRVSRRAERVLGGDAVAVAVGGDGGDAVCPGGASVRVCWWWSEVVEPWGVVGDRPMGEVSRSLLDEVLPFV